jgi:hypothetical protein
MESAGVVEENKRDSGRVSTCVDEVHSFQNPNYVLIVLMLKGLVVSA